MKLIQWNISWGSSKEAIGDSLSKDITGEFIVCLQEVTPSVYKYLHDRFIHMGCRFVYSLDWRSPGEFDSRSRRLGVMIMTSKEFEPLNCGVLRRSPFPDRTAYFRFKYEGDIYTVLSLHSVTGCNYKRAKSVQFDSFAEAIIEMEPDFVTFDANEPDQDHYEIGKMVFFNNLDKGSGARHFFNALNDSGLRDAYVNSYDTNRFIPGQPLATSHIVGKDEHKRYDFIFYRESRFRNLGCEYPYEDSLKATSDHSKVILSGDLLKSKPSNYIAEQHDCSYSRQELLSKCRYYREDEPDNDHGFAFYERAWVDMMMEDAPSVGVDVAEYVAYGLDTFNMDDGVPESLKAILWNRYSHGGTANPEEFRKWYLECYIGGKGKLSKK